jgi:DNA-binding NtrC family response regulator
MYKNVNLLIVDDDESLVKVFERIAEEQGWSLAIARTGTDAIEQLNKAVIEVAVVDINLPGYTGMQILDYVKNNGFPTEIIMITGVATVETAVQSIKKGACDYLTKPFEDLMKVIIVINKAMEKYRLLKKIRRLERQAPDKYTYEGIVGKSRKMQEMFSIIDNIAATTSTVLILGESGTGKELVAKAIHDKSKRKGKNFVVINCAAIPEHLLESELFGHKKGSFTGAIQDKKGLFEEADSGTIFLDEVGEIPPSVQVKLLRVLQEGEIRPVGGNVSKHVDVRLIAATNQDLSQMVTEGTFREDLYYRINVINLVLPPLRERGGDVTLLAYHFLQKYSEKIGKKVTKISVDALQALQNYQWVGNVRELENVIERSVVLSTGDTIQAKDLPPRVLGESFYLADKAEEADLSQYNYQEAKDRALWLFNRSYVSNLLHQTSCVHRLE